MNISVDAIRFYESKGLIVSGQRSAGGYRIFDYTELEKLQFIQRAKKVGFTLDEISELLELRLHPDAHTCNEVKDYTQKKITELSRKIVELEKIKSSLEQLHDACCGGPESAENCSILHLLDSEDPL